MQKGLAMRLISIVYQGDALHQRIHLKFDLHALTLPPPPPRFIRLCLSPEPLVMNKTKSLYGRR